MPRSQAEVRLAHSVLAGTAKSSGMNRDYAKEVVDKMHGRHLAALPEHAGTKKKKAKP